MKKRILTVISFGLLLAAAMAQIVDEIPRQTAMTWLILVDEEKYGESWKTASPLFKKALGEEDWTKKIGESRKALGALKLREFARGRFLKDPEGMPPGEYFALEFYSEFEKRRVVEMVVPMKDQTGLWQVSYYSIVPLEAKPAAKE